MVDALMPSQIGILASVFLSPVQWLAGSNVLKRVIFIIADSHWIIIWFM